MTKAQTRPVVLAVDDTPENLDVVKGILGNEYTVKAATNGATALKIAAKHAPDLILLDIMMPGMDGYEVCRVLKSDPATREIPVIFLTAMEQTTDEAKGFELGAADYIKKPVNPLILKARVATHVALKRSMDELQEAYAVIKLHRDRMQQELTVGHDIQMSMVPLTFPAFPERTEFDLHAALTPAREVGGDFYDFFFVDDDRLCMVVGDVSGKGVPAALFMAVTQTMIRAQAVGDPSPASIMTRVNDDISSENPASMFVTLFLAILNVRTGHILYTNAGHNPPYTLTSDGGVSLVAERHGPVVGAVPALAYREGELQLQAGDTLFIYTDGITEAMDIEGKLFSDARLTELLREIGAATPSVLLEKVQCSIDGFQGAAEQADDITQLAMRFEGVSATNADEVLEVSIFNKLSEIEVAISAFSTFAEEHQLAPDITRKLKIVFDELLNNVISYAFPDGGEHRVSVRLDLSAARLKIVFSDDGIPFNPFVQASPDTTLAIEDREIGGLGILLVDQLMDKATYQRRSTRNVVTLTKLLAD